MRKIVKELNVYEFKELSEEAKKTVYEELREKLINDNFENFKIYVEEILKNCHKLKNFDYEYSLSYCQGDGICIFNNKFNLLRYNIIKNNDFENANIFEKFILKNQVEPDF